ncbi:MAG: enoyl-CoA hydratase-related protein, partial [Comamonas sp.]
MSETTQDILVHTEAGVRTITFNRVDKKNSITQVMYGAMADALTTAATDDAVRVVVFQGDATIFSAGNDIGDFLSRQDGQGLPQESPTFRFLHSIAAFPKPIIAAVAGPAVGIGT